MLYIAYTFFIFALVAALLAFSGVVIVSVVVAKICFYVFLVIFILSLITHKSQRKK